MLNLTKFTANNGVSYNVDGKINCRTANLIYGIYCEQCRQIVYVGETGNTVYERMQNHLSCIRNKKQDVVPIHFNQQDHNINDFKIIGIEKINKSWIYRKEKEKFWMKKIGTLNEQGMNKKG